MTPAVAVPLIRRSDVVSGDVVSGLSQSADGLRRADSSDARAIYDLICAHVDEGHLLPRHLNEVTAHVHRFIVAVDEGQVIACADLAPLSRAVAEVRSLVVDDAARSNGIGRQLIDALIEKAERAGFEKLCAFTHAPGYFVQLGFSIVPHEWMPEKIQTDCGTCAQFRRCGQYAVMLPLTHTEHAFVPLASLHG